MAGIITITTKKLEHLIECKDLLDQLAQYVCIQLEYKEDRFPEVLKQILKKLSE